jgi:hypothetical protein
MQAFIARNSVPLGAETFEAAWVEGAQHAGASE